MARDLYTLIGFKVVYVRHPMLPQTVRIEPFERLLIEFLPY
jgi:hypothetical protein